MTEPGRIWLTISSVTSLGALAPGISTAPITTSASLTLSAILKELDIRVWIWWPKRFSSSDRRLALISRIVTCAPSPKAMRAACVPTTPPPMIVTFPLGTPGTPPSSTPEPPSCLVKK